MRILVGPVEKISLVVVAVISILILITGQKEMALGAVAGGLLFIADFAVIRVLVQSYITKTGSLGFNLFLIALKFLLFLLIIVSLLLFAKLNIYGFIIALTAVVIVIIVTGLKGNKDGTF